MHGKISRGEIFTLLGRKMTIKIPPDLVWLRQHSPIFAKLADQVIDVKKSEAQYREFKKRLTEERTQQ